MEWSELTGAAPISVERLRATVVFNRDVQSTFPHMETDPEGQYVRYAALLQQLAEREARILTLRETADRATARADDAERAREEAEKNAARYLAFRGADDGAGAADIEANTIYRRGAGLDAALDAFLAASGGDRED